MRVFVGQPLPEPSTSELLSGHEVVTGKGGLAPEEVSVHLAVADAFLPTPRERVSREVLGAAPRLAIVATCSVGTDHIDLAACRERGIVVSNTPGVLTDATADLAFALILSVTRRMTEGEALARSGTWDGWKPLELLGKGLQGKTLGIYGMGRIGTAVARRGEAFGMRILGMTEKDGPDLFERLLAESDVLSIHVPLTPGTRGRFGRAEFSRMKRGAFLVNTARGPIVEEEALATALEEGRLGGAGLDVYREGALHPSAPPRAEGRHSPPAPRLGDDRDATRDGAYGLGRDRALLPGRAASPSGRLNRPAHLSPPPPTGYRRPDMETDASRPSLRFDVVVLGGAIAGSSAALLLRRWQPELSVLVLEKGTAFDWKVGESTVEISAYFLTRVLKLYDYLTRDQVTKQGFRYWFHNGDVRRLREASEVGPSQLARTPGLSARPLPPRRARLSASRPRRARKSGAPPGPPSSGSGTRPARRRTWSSSSAAGSGSRCGPDGSWTPPGGPRRSPGRRGS